MVQRLVSRYYKIPVLIVLFTILNSFIIVSSNIIIDGKNFVINGGEYSYDDLFYTKDSNMNYYNFSRGYYEADKCINMDALLKDAKFYAINELKAVTMLSFIGKKSTLGYYSLNIENAGDEDLYKNINYSYSGYAYEVFGKIYFYTFIKDFVYVEDDKLSKEDNLYLATKTQNSKSVAVYVVEGTDLSALKQGSEQVIAYGKPFLDIFDIPYRYVFMLICLIEIFFVGRQWRNSRKTEK